MPMKENKKSSRQAENEEKLSVWKVINSPFFLWFLSTIVIGTGTFIFGKWQEQRKICLSNQEIVRKLDLEISNRLSFFCQQTIAKVSQEEALLILERPAKSDFPPGVFPEFANRTLRALLWELHSLVLEPEKNEIERAINEANNFKKVYLATIKEPDLLKDLLGNETDEGGLEIEKQKITKGKNEFNSAQSPLPKRDENTQEKDTTPANNKGGIQAKPFHISIDMKVAIDIDQTVLNTARITLQAFNINRWGFPFQDLALRTDVKSESNLPKNSKMKSRMKSNIFNKNN